MINPDLLESIATTTAGVVGIYCLFLSGECMYVGKADCIASRISTHIKKGIVFDCVEIVDLRESILGLDYNAAKTLLNYREACEIERLNPKLNRQRPSVVGFFRKLPLSIQSDIIAEIPSAIKGSE